jgi:hypothetical protein
LVYATFHDAQGLIYDDDFIEYDESH